MSIWTSLEPASATVDAGATTTVALRLRNTGDVVEEYRIVLVGAPAQWARAEPAVLKLYPGTGGTVELVFAPPRSPDATAGPSPYGVQVLPTEQPEATVVVEGILSVTPFTALYAELLPPTCRGRLRGRARMAIDNLGNTPVTAALLGRDQADRLDVEPAPSSVQIAPGRAAFTRVTVRSKQPRWVGGKENLPFSVTVQRSGAEPVAVVGTYLQRGVLPRWAVQLLAGVAALATVAAALWVATRPTSASRATEVTASASPQPVAASSSPLPSASQTRPQTQPGEGQSAAAPVVPIVPPVGGGTVGTVVQPVGGTGSSSGGTPPGPTTSSPSPGPTNSTPGGGGGTQGGGGGTASPGPPILPITAANSTGPNLFVEYAQEKLRNLPSGNGCRLTVPVATGVLDEATAEKVTCFQRTTDGTWSRPGNIEWSDPPGTLGRATLTALTMYDVITNEAAVESGKSDWEITCVAAALVWADQTALSQADLDAESTFVRQSLDGLAGRAPYPATAFDANNGALQKHLSAYAADVQPTNGTQSTTAIVNALIGGWVKDYHTPGTVSASTWPRVYPS